LRTNQGKYLSLDKDGGLSQATHCEAWEYIMIIPKPEDEPSPATSTVANQFLTPHIVFLKGA
jgi:hypothetical protein